MKEEVKFQRDKLHVSAYIDQNIYPIGMTIHHITGIFAEPKMKYVNTVLLEGGFSECKPGWPC